MIDDRDKKNSVFASHNAAIEQMMNKGSGAEIFDTAVQLAPLPSSGLVYPVGSSLYGKDSIEIKSLTAREEDILTNSAYAKKGTILTELLKACILDKSVDPADMLVSDRYAVLVAIRAVGYGDTYDEEIACSECGVKTTRTFNLSMLPIKRLELEPCEQGKNLFSYVLPTSKKEINFRFMTGRDEEDMHVASEKQKKLGVSTETNVTSALIRMIVSIDGIEDKGKIANFVRNMPARDSLALRKYVGDHQPGVTFKQDSTCSACGHTEEVAVPIGVGFLWPNSK